MFMTNDELEGIRSDARFKPEAATSGVLEDLAAARESLDQRDPTTWPKWCRATRPHPLAHGQRQRCMQVGPHGAHIWEEL